MLKLGQIPFDGCFAVYMRYSDGRFEKLFSGADVTCISEQSQALEVIRLYPFDDIIIVEVKE